MSQAALKERKGCLGEVVWPQTKVREVGALGSIKEDPSNVEEGDLVGGDNND